MHGATTRIRKAFKRQSVEQLNELKLYPANKGNGN
jgi:hypothetical protein